MSSGPAVVLAETEINGRALASKAKVPSDAIQTKEGTFYVSKPYRSSYNKKLKAAIAFVPRRSHFDIENEQSGANEFRGFFTLFWISLFLFTVRSYVRSIETNGYPLNFEFASMFSRDARTLALSDAVLVLSTGLCVPFAKAVQKGWIKYYYYGVVIQHLFQTLVLFTAVKWTFNRHWPWVQSGFLTLHTLTLIMKMHSYNTVNGYLKWASEESGRLLTQLRTATERVGGWDAALAAAKQNLEERDAAAGTTSSSPGVGTPDMPDGSQKSYVDAPVAAALRNRLVRVSEDVAAEAQEEKPKPVGPFPHPLVDHPDAEISALAADYTDAESDLVGMGPEYVRWPANLTYKNFAVYMLIPSLVYELEYPRTNKIRPLYVFEKTVATGGTFALLYTVTETFILPLTPGPDQSFFRSLLDLALPFMLAYLLLFYIIFECICNGFAELSYFADRGFYEDWWNSTSWEEFSRKWNKPVHTFLLRHVYASSISSYHLSRSGAMFFTFLISALAHELVMAVVTQKIRMYLFTLQLIQIPLIAVGRIPAIKRNKLMGNMVFWLGLYAGFPLLCVAYVAY
ncbi:MBOAT-domain-containing protein [Auriscalpium vulgare]|uniref:MBOAT-domain-containing protein n=1 Tax=Auriscalpium vulgare TaxID=40419 RepID=A0ACB8RAZ4_9AGAM|nr:MBOAT-domain-containing protein [Auriscalpium vulgare]